MRAVLVVVLLAVALVAVTAADSPAANWWRFLDPCDQASQSGWHHPGWVVACVTAIMLDGMHGAIWQL